MATLTGQAAAVPRMAPIAGETELERLVSRSRLIGADPELVVHGGGNTSSKVRETDHLGRRRTVLRIKGSGTDLKTIGPDGFPGLFLDELLPLRERPAMTDEAMVAYLAHCMVEPGSRRPSIETLLHAFLPARHVDHVHADAICALTNNPDPERHVRAALGADVAVVPYIRPGFELSRQVADLAGSRAVVLAKHGLVTWGETHEESYGLTLELVQRARDYLAPRTRPATQSGAPELADAERERLLVALRGRLSRERRRVLHVDRGQRAFADRADVAQVATAARATPDHILRIGARSAVVAAVDEAASAVDAYERDYRAYFARHRDRLPAGLGMLDPLPRVFLVPGLGCVAVGGDAATARVNAEIAYRSHLVTTRVLDAFGEVAWLNEAEVFDFDYWPLELAKLASAPPPKELAGQIAIVTGAASAVGGAIAARLARDGAHLVLVDPDPDALADGIAGVPPDRVAIVAAATEPDLDDRVVPTAIDRFGGVDLLVATAPPPTALVCRLAGVLRDQGLGGTIVVLGSDDALRGVDAGLGSAVPGLRVNAVDAAEGADAVDAAEAVAFLASARSRGTSGAVLPVAVRDRDQ